MNLQTEINELFVKQQDEWEQLKKAIEQLDKIREKEFSWGDTFTVRVQFNPARMTSTAAKTDKEAVEKRPCFLCETNRPLLQRGVPFLGKYSILCNPFPILRNHVTIPIHSHVPQRITLSFITDPNVVPQHPIIFICRPGSRHRSCCRVIMHSAPA